MTNLIPREFILQLLSRIEIVDLIDGRVPLKKKSGSNYFACCPFHTEKSPSFSVSQTKQFYHCFGCGAHGNAIDFLIQYDHLNFPEAVELLAKQIGMEIPRDSSIPEKSAKQISLYELLKKITHFYQIQLRQNERAVAYLKQRGLSGEIAKNFALGYAPSGWDQLIKQFPGDKYQLIDAGMLIKKDDGSCYDRFRDRILFPIHDRRGRVIGFGGRILDKGEPKYLNSPETPIFQKGHELYGLFHALQKNRQLHRALIVEGYMDVISLFQHGIHYAVATLGTATTANHLQRLFRYTSEIIFCFDGDAAGRLAAERALQVTLPIMKDGIQIRFLFLPEGEDPDSLIRKENKEKFEERITHAVTIADFFFQTIAQQTDMKTTDGRARFVKLAQEQLNVMPESIFQQMLFTELANKTRLSIEQLKSPKTIAMKPVIRKANSPSALRLAMALLVQYPKLAELLTEPLPKLSLRGFNLFAEILDSIKPGDTLATVIENWRDKPNANTIAKLAQLDTMIPESGVQKEFLGAILHLKKLATQQNIEELLLKAAQQGLSEEEKITLNALIQAKQ